MFSKLKIKFAYRDDDKVKWYFLEQPLFYKDFCVPKNFQTDCASTPKVLWFLFPPQHKFYSRAAILHDYLYSMRPDIPRWKCDLIFLNAIKDEGYEAINKSKRNKFLKVYDSFRITLLRYSFYFAVSLFGWLYRKR